MKKYLLFILLCLLSNLSGYAANISAEDLLEATGISTYGMNIYYGFTTDQITPVGTVDATLAQILQSTESKLVLFVDEEPEKGWEHNCSYYYAATYTINGQIPYYKVSSKIPSEDYELTELEISVSEDDVIANVPQTCLNGDLLNASSHTYAVIVSGGANVLSNYARYWNDCSFIYQTLTKRFGVSKSHISLLISDGTDPADDMLISGGTFASSPLDLDGDGINDTQYAATKQNLTNVLQNLSSVMTSQDNLFLYVIDHGGTDDFNGTSYIWLWNGQKMYDYELASLLDDFSVNSINIVLGQCYSGGFIDNLSASNRVIATACTASQKSYACSNLIYDEFVFHWTSAVNESTPSGNYVLSDNNNDGFVSMREAFDYADYNDQKNETPQFSSPTTSLGNTLAFNEIPFHYQLIVRDNEDDDGTEPNITTTDAWSSPDLWTRNQQDGIEHPYHESININSEHLYTYVRVKNIGQKRYDGDSVYIHLFWAPASLGLTDDAWNGNTDIGGSLMPRKLRQVILPDDSYIYEYQWEVPDAIIDSVEISGGSFHVCHLVALSTSSRQMMPLPLIENSHVVDVLGNNWIAQRNISFYSNSSNASTELPLYVRNVYDEARDYSIEILPVENSVNDLSKIETCIRLSAPLYSAWEKGGRQTNKAVAYKSHPERFYLKGEDSRIENIGLLKGRREKIYCTGSVIAEEDITEERTYKYNIVQRDRNTGNIVGGERIEILVKPRKALIPIIRQSIEGSQIRLTASNIEEAASYEWFDENGYLVGKGKELLLSPETGNREYKLKVCAENDAAINYAFTSVTQKQGLEKITPIPFKDRINVKLSLPADDDTYISLTPVNAVNKTENYHVTSGESEMTIYISNYVKGTYLVSLLRNGKVIDSRHIVNE